MEKEVIIAPASEVDVVENFLNENYEFRVNVISDKTEYRKLKVEGGVEDCFRPCTDPALNTIVISARKELAEEVGNPRTLIKELIHSELVKLYDPLKDYIENLPEWDGTDRVVELFGRVPGISGKQIVDIFKSEYPHLTVNHSFKIQLGRHLGQSGFQSKISRGSTLYFAVNTKVA